MGKVEMSKATIAANQCANGCGRERRLPRPKKNAPEEMTHGSKYCAECSKVAKVSFRQMIADKRQAQTERFAQFAGLVKGVLGGADSEYLGVSPWYVRVAPANTSFAYFLLTRGGGIAVRLEGESGVLIRMASEDAAALVAEALDAGLTALGQTTVSVRYTDKVGQTVSAGPEKPRLQE